MNEHPDYADSSDEYAPQFLRVCPAITWPFLTALNAADCVLRLVP